MTPNDRPADGEPRVSAPEGDGVEGPDCESLGPYRLLRLVKVVLAVLVSLLTIADLLGLLPA